MRQPGATASPHQNYVNEPRLASVFEMQRPARSDYLPEGYRAVLTHRALAKERKPRCRPQPGASGADEKKLVRRYSRTSTPPVTQPEAATELVSSMISPDWYNGAHGKSRDFGDMYEAGCYCRRTPMKPNPRAVLHPASADRKPLSASFLVPRSGAGRRDRRYF